ncbi:hypothetical protein [Kineosporia sp. NBRC 101731]|uniref:hypothetical protein n=1 Tax=Kineosporia sp. NBRC 101731 TaxID=3032199 RepID=UPI002554670C|nr:hypothetical protein [Kineosporia sp. NBRC 101731]
MNPDPDIERFLDFSAGMVNINALFQNWEDNFVEAVANLRLEADQQSFRKGFAKSLAGMVTPDEYESRTGWDFDSAEELHDHLKSLWVRFYGDAVPADSLR